MRGGFFLYNDAHTSSTLSTRVASNKVLGVIMLNARQLVNSKFSCCLTNTVCVDSNVLGMAQNRKKKILLIRSMLTL